MVVKLIMYTVNTGLITVIDAALGLICYAVMPNTLVFIAFYLNLSKCTFSVFSPPLASHLPSLTTPDLLPVYVNSYLASLNVRKTLLSSMKGSGARSGDWASVHLSHDGSPGVSHDMPAFRSVTATGLSVSMPESSVGYGRGAIGLDLEIGSGTSSSQSKGDVSTAVNTPIDGTGTLPQKGEPVVVGADTQRYPPGILVLNDKRGELVPESRYEAPTRRDASVQTPMKRNASVQAVLP